MSLGDIVTPTCTFCCEITGSGNLWPGMRLRVTRVFDTSGGQRVAVADEETGRVLSHQVPVWWLEIVKGVEA